MTAPTPAALDALAAELLADRALGVPASLLHLKAEAALQVLRAQVETLTADLRRTKSDYESAVLNRNYYAERRKVAEAESGAHKRAYEAIFDERELHKRKIAAAEARALAADTARASAETTLAEVLDVLEREVGEFEFDSADGLTVTVGDFIRKRRPRAALEQRT